MADNRLRPQTSLLNLITMGKCKYISKCKKNKASHLSINGTEKWIVLHRINLLPSRDNMIRPKI